MVYIVVGGICFVIGGVFGMLVMGALVANKNNKSLEEAGWDA